MGNFCDFSFWFVYQSLTAICCSRCAKPIACADAEQPGPRTLLLKPQDWPVASNPDPLTLPGFDKKSSKSTDREPPEIKR